ncbi:hypothetical protein HanRHA438_Chr13g0613851 [Helianthus annuus]|nr:hypothetical protein HanRHA438_Chr13g0613851 [Helianthus annuus]
MHRWVVSGGADVPVVFVLLVGGADGLSGADGPGVANGADILYDVVVLGLRVLDLNLRVGWIGSDSSKQFFRPLMTMERQGWWMSMMISINLSETYMIRDFGRVPFC